MNMAEALQEAAARFDLYDDIIVKIKFGKLTKNEEYEQLGRMWALKPPAIRPPDTCPYCWRSHLTDHEAGCPRDPKAG